MARSDRKPFQVTPPPQAMAGLPTWAQRHFYELQELVNELLERVEALENP